MLQESQGRAFNSVVTLKEVEPSLHTIMDAVQRTCDVHHRDFISHHRYWHYCRARHIYCYLARKLTSKSFPQIARLANRDHSSMVHGYQMVERNPGRYEPELSRAREAIGTGA